MLCELVSEPESECLLEITSADESHRAAAVSILKSVGAETSSDAVGSFDSRSERTQSEASLLSAKGPDFQRRREALLLAETVWECRSREDGWQRINTFFFNERL